MSVPARVGGAWRALHPDQRLAAIAALALLASMLLPWYEETGFALVQGGQSRIDDSKNAFQVYSFVEAAIFLVTIGVVALMYARGRRKAFHLPGGDGTVVLAAGLWVMFLIFFRQLDKPDPRDGPISTSVGVSWGIFIAFLLGALLAYAGFRIRAAHVAEPAAREPREPPEPPRTAPTRRVPRRSPVADDAPTRVEGQLSFDEPEPVQDPPELHPPPRRDRRRT